MSKYINKYLTTGAYIVLLTVFQIFGNTARAQDPDNINISITKFTQLDIVTFEIVYSIDTDLVDLTMVREQGIYVRRANNFQYIVQPVRKAVDTLLATVQYGSNVHIGAYFVNEEDEMFVSDETNVQTLAPEPTAPCSELALVSLTNSSASVGFTLQTGTNSRYGLIILVEGSSPFPPDSVKDATSYTQPIHCCNVVHNSIAQKGPFTINTLTPNTTYTVSVIPFNQVGNRIYSINYKTDIISTLTFTTPKGVPTTQVSNLQINNIDSTTANVLWQNGNGEGRVVYINNAPTFVAPQDGQYPSSNNIYSGSGQQAVYKGEGSSINVSGLIIGQTYYLRAFEYNKLTEENPVYNITTSVNNPSSFTLTTERPNPQDSAITYSSRTSNTISLTWKNGGGENRLVVMNTTNSFTLPADSTQYVANSVWNNNGQQVVYNGSGNNVTITNLTENTIYHFRVFAYNKTPEVALFNTSTSYNNPVSIATNAAAPLSQDSNIVFSNITSNSVTVSWSRGSGDYSLLNISDNDNYILPADGSVPATNTEWQNTGSQWVYSGTQTSVVVTGLTNGKTYYFKVFGYKNTQHPVYQIKNSLNNPNSIKIFVVRNCVWTGNVSINWFDAGNWSSNILPTKFDNVLIPETEKIPTIAYATEVNNLTLASKGRLSIENTSTLTVNGDITILGDAISSGSLVIGVGSKVDVVNNSYFTRHTGNQEVWHLASMPNNNKDIKQYKGYYVNKWEEATGWTRLTTNDTVIKMKGYSVKQKRSDTIRYVGAFNNGEQSIAVTKLNADSEVTGWNMVGNPYPSAIDWGASDGWSRQNINNTVYKFDTQINDYVTYNYETGIGVPANTDGIIPAGNGFYVLSETENATLTINNKARLHSFKPYLKNRNENKKQMLRLSFTNGVSTDQTAILFHPKATDEINNSIDAPKPPQVNNENLRIYSITPQQRRKMTLTSLNTSLLNELTDNEYIEVAIGCSGYSLMPTQIVLSENTIGTEFNVYLYNNITNEYHDLKTPYFPTKDQENSSTTFALRITRSGCPLSINNNKIYGLELYSVKNEIIINSQEPISGTVKIVDLTGQTVYIEELRDITYHKINNLNKGGLMVVSIDNREKKHSKLLFVE